MLVTDIADEILSCKVSIKFPTCPKMISESIITSPTWQHLKFLCSISVQVVRPQITRSTSWSSKINQNDRRVVVNDSITTHVLLFAISWSFLSTWMLYNFGRKLPSVFSGILKHFRLYLSNTSIRIYYWKLKICVWYAYQCKFTRVYIQNTRNIPRYYTLILENFYLRNIFTDYVVNRQWKFSLHINSRGCTRFIIFHRKWAF